MASIINSIEEHPEYLYDHLICIELKDSKTQSIGTPRCVALDPFTNQIYVFIYKSSVIVYDLREGESPFIRIGIVMIYSQCGEFLRSFPLDDMEDYSHYVHCMAKHRNNVYIVSLPSRILHFKVADSMTLIGRKNARGSGIGEFEEPRQLDISSEGDLFVADFGRNRVQILDGNLQYKRHISDHSMLEPCDIKLTPDEVYVLGDNPEESTYCLHIFTYLGEKLRSIILNGIPNCMPWRGFCVDTRGNVAIIDNENFQIKFFTKEGNLIETMATLNLGCIFKIYTSLIGITWITNQKLIVLSDQLPCGKLEILSYI